MKTASMIRQRAKTLESKLRSKKSIYENFGDKEIRLLGDFVGDIYEYPPTERQGIQTIQDGFFDFCINYEG